jgi:hypothetical protein
MVEATPTTTYGEIIETALEDLCKGAAASYRPYAISFWQPSDDDGSGLGRSSYVLAVVRPDGSADWKPWHEVTVEEAERARALGLLAGDHTRPYAFVLPQIGNGTLPIWADLAHMLEILQQVAELLTIPGGLAATYWLIRGRPKEAVARHGGDWQERGRGFSTEKSMPDTSLTPLSTSSISGKTSSGSIGPSGRTVKSRSSEKR